MPYQFIVALADQQRELAQEILGSVRVGNVNDSGHLAHLIENRTFITFLGGTSMPGVSGDCGVTFPPPAPL